MKRSYLKRKPYKLKRSRLKKKSIKGELIEECDRLFRQILLRERPPKCEHCYKTHLLQVSHILPKGRYPRSRYSKNNVFLLNRDCHLEWWHKNPLAAAEFVKKVRGENYIEKLLVYDRTLPKLINHQLNLYKFVFEKELGGS